MTEFGKAFKRQVTVFGGSGFLGRHLVARLAGHGALVRIAVRDPQSAAFLKVSGDVGQIVPVACDIRDPASVAAALKGADAAVNLVGILYESGLGRHRRTFDGIHHLGAKNIARAAFAEGIKDLVHVSALGASPDSPSLYARTKAAGEEAVAQAFPDAVILRPSVVFGPEDNFFNQFASLMRIMPILPVLGCGWPKLTFSEKSLPKLDLFPRSGPGNIGQNGISGGVRFQPVYVGDVADAMLCALQNPAARGGLYELAGPKVYSFKALMELLMTVTGRKCLLVPWPRPLAMIDAAFLGLLPKPLLTIDQVRLMDRDNVASGSLPGLEDLGVSPTLAEVVLPAYLSRFRRGGSAGKPAKKTP